MQKRNGTGTIYWWTTALAALGLGATVVWSYTDDTKPAKAQYPSAQVTRGTIERNVIAAGAIQPVEFVDVGAQISGQLRHLKVRLGERVVKGQLLAEIDPTLNQSKVVEGEATLENLRAQRHAKQEQRVLAEQQRRRGEALLRQDALARSEAEVFDANYRVAVSTVSALDAQIKQAQASLDTARATLGFTRILAPMDGEVVSILAREGQTLNANNQAPVILRIARLDTMTVWAQVAEADVTRLRIGQEAYFTVLGEPDKKRAGTIQRILPGPEIINGVVFYNALFNVPNPDQALKVQMTAQVFFVLDRAENALLVPLSALSQSESQGKSNASGKHSIRVIGPDGDGAKRSVEVGVRNAVFAQVTKGLEEGDTVVIGEREGSGRAGKTSGIGSKPKIR